MAGARPNRRPALLFAALALAPLGLSSGASAQAPACDFAQAEQEMSLSLMMRSGLPNRDEQRLLDGEAASLRAASIYRACLDAGIGERSETLFALGQAYRQGHRLRDAIDAFSVVRDGSGAEARLVTAAAREIVFCLQDLVREDPALRGFARASTSRHSDRSPPTPMTSLLQELVTARDAYLDRPDADPADAAEFRLANSRLFLAYGRTTEAQRLLGQLLDRQCTGPTASHEGLDAYGHLIDIALERGDAGEVHRLAGWIEDRRCTFHPTRSWRPSGAFSTSVVQVQDDALRTLAESAWALERRGAPGALRAYLDLAMTADRRAAEPDLDLTTRADDVRVSADALSRAAALPLEPAQRRRVARAMRDLVDRSRRTFGDPEPRADIHLALSDLLRADGFDAEADAALLDAYWATQRSPLPPSWPSARALAETHLARAVDDLARLERSLVVAPGVQPTVQQYLQVIREQIERQRVEVRSFEESLSSLFVFDERIPALVAIGRAHEARASGIVNAVLLPLPEDLQRRIGGATPAHQVQLQLDDQIRHVLREQWLPVQCAAVARYAQALADAETLGVEHTSLHVARDRLRLLGERVVDGCLLDHPRLRRAGLAAVATPPMGATLDGATSAPPALEVRR